MKIHPDVLKAHAQFGGDLELMQKAYEYDDLKAEITTLRSSLSTARAEGIREGLEMAAKYHDDLEAQHAAAHRHIESDHHMLMERQHRRHAAAIRAKIEEVKP